MNGLPLWHLLGVLAVPTFGVLLGILLNQRGNNRLVDRVDRLSDRLDRRMERIEEEQHAFRKQMHDEYIDLLGRIGDHAQRIVRFEERSSR
jgi:hypothetical protein